MLKVWFEKLNILWQLSCFPLYLSHMQFVQELHRRKPFKSSRRQVAATPTATATAAAATATATTTATAIAAIAATTAGAATTVAQFCFM